MDHNPMEDSYIAGNTYKNGSFTKTGTIKVDTFQFFVRINILLLVVNCVFP